MNCCTAKGEVKGNFGLPFAHPLILHYSRVHTRKELTP